MENDYVVKSLHERVDRADVKLDALTAACQILAVTAGKHDEQIGILTKIFYGGAALFFAQVVIMMFRAAK